MTQLDRRTLLRAGLTTSLLAALPVSSSASETQPDISGKSILITGASSGFGRLGALYYAGLGAKVIATMRNLPRPEADQLRAITEERHLDLHLVELDVLNEASVNAGVAKAVALIGHVPDVIVNNAGLAIVGPVEAQDDAAMRLAYETNVFGYQRLHRAVLPAMKVRKSGHIINMSSQSGRLIYPGLGQYCPTKFAIEAMSESLAYEVAPFGIDITIIQPGGYPTEFWRNRETYTAALKARANPANLEGYGTMSEQMGSGNIPKLKGDPLDVPRAIALAIAASRETKSLRVMVSAGGHPQTDINQINRETHLKFLG
ncbi:MAG: SDR family oxidoreductase, partial [Asticcacaulis sp.]